jgi:autotransporter-associated beta strand protein
LCDSLDSERFPTNCWSKAERQNRGKGGFRGDAVVQGTDFSGAAITGAGKFLQAGTGTTTLNIASTYSGGTLIATVDGALGTGNVSLLAGTVTLTLQGATNNYIADTATLSYVSGNAINPNFTGNETVSSLVVDGVAQAPGLYGAGGTNPDGVFSDTGFLLVVVPEPGTILMFGLGLGLLAGVNRFRHKRN